MTISLVSALPASPGAASSVTAATGVGGDSGGLSGLFALLFQDAKGAQTLLPQGADADGEASGFAALLQAADAPDAGTQGLAAWLAGLKTGAAKGEGADLPVDMPKSNDADTDANADADLTSLVVPLTAPVEAKAVVPQGLAAQPSAQTTLSGSADPSLSPTLAADAADDLSAGKLSLAAGGMNTANLADGDSPSSSGQQAPGFASLLAERAAAPQTAQTPQAAPAATPEQRIDAPISDAPRWTAQVGDKVIWMNKNGVQEVRLQLTPANLGPMTISLSLSGEEGKAHAVFTAATAEVRHTLEEAMPRLREMLSASGISLDSTQVGQQFRDPRQAQARWEDAIENHNHLGANTLECKESIQERYTAPHLMTAQTGVGLVNLFV
ncbi:MAG: flagellar hook-length control protein FliK [Zoogloeaceae bacterium]|nr:flagellar hook-length control protein FliK [Zoogloeaceae bacterium]